MYKKIGIISREEKQFNQNYKVFNDEIVKVINKYNCLAVGIIVDFEQNPDVEFNKIKNGIREELGKYLFSETECKPMILIVIQEV